MTQQGGRVELMDTESDDGEPRLEIVDEDSATSNDDAKRENFNPAMNMAVSNENAIRIVRKSLSFNGENRNSVEEDTNASEAIESLLMLGQGPVLSPRQKMRSSSLCLSPVGSEAFDHFSSDDQGSIKGPNGVVSYYQKMRERNNMASKRCRLKRRLKAESMETQANILQLTNKRLKERIAKLVKIGDIIKDGVQQIQKKECNCTEVVSKIKQVKWENPDESLDNLSNCELVAKSRLCREKPMPDDQVISTCLASSEDETSQVMRMDSTSSNSNSLPPTPTMARSFHQHPSLSIIPISTSGSLTIRPVLTSPLNLTTITPVVPKAKTALDVINETIIMSLKSSSPVPDIKKCPFDKLSLIRIAPKPSITNQISSSRNDTFESPESTVVIKYEPEVKITESQQPTKISTLHDQGDDDDEEDDDEGVDPLTNCIAMSTSQQPNVKCEGEKLNLNKLTSYLDLFTMTPSFDSGKSAMERAIIKSRLNIPFWQIDEFPTFICERHRYELINGLTEKSRNCVLCNKKRAKKTNSSQSVMMTITYRMSLENYTTTGNILPIGLFVCGFCKEKHFKGIDVSESNNITSNGRTQNLASGVSITAVKVESAGEENEMEGAKTSTFCESTTISRKTSNLDSSHDTAENETLESSQIVRSTDNIFTKIGKLNEALNSINPSYKPIGFSITSIESCSKNVLSDAVLATETAVSTLMSVIAPGQEAFLWESIKPKLDSKLKMTSSSSKQQCSAPEVMEL